MTAAYRSLGHQWSMTALWDNTASHTARTTVIQKACWPLETHGLCFWSRDSWQVLAAAWEPLEISQTLNTLEKWQITAVSKSVPFFPTSAGTGSGSLSSSPGFQFAKTRRKVFVGVCNPKISFPNRLHWTLKIHSVINFYQFIKAFCI